MPLPPTVSTAARVGCDVQGIAAVAGAVRQFGDRYLDRVFTRTEQDACRRGDAAAPLSARSVSPESLSAESLAARFAAKEAVLKLLGTADGVDLREVEVTGAGTRPGVRLHGEAARLAERAGLGPIDLSLSHDGPSAFAVAVALMHPTHLGEETR